MRYIFVLIASAIFFVSCNPKINVQPTGSFDTLGIHWMTIERNNIYYYFQGSGEKGASIYTDLHEDAYSKLAPVFNAKLPHKLRFFVWTSPSTAEQKLGMQLGFTMQYECVCNVRADQTLGHEMTHALSYWADGTPASNYTRLVTEGVAVAFDLRGDDKIQTAKEALAGTNFHSITDFWTAGANNMSEDTFYPVAGAFMDFLYKKNMSAEFKALLKHETREEAEIIYGKDKLDALIAEFNGQVGLK